MPRLFHRPPGNSRFAGLLPDSEVILVVDIAEIPEKRAFRGICPHPLFPSTFTIFTSCTSIRNWHEMNINVLSCQAVNAVERATVLE